MLKKSFIVLPIVFFIFGLAILFAGTAVKPAPVTVLFVGDVCFDWGVKDVIATGFYPFAHVDSFIEKATISIFNLETCISTNGEKVEKTYNFRCPPGVLKYITNSGFDIATLGNNHTMDYGPIALADTLDNLKMYHLKYTGAGKNLAQAVVPVIIVTNGVTVGTLSFGYMNPPTLKAAENKPGVAPIDTKLMTAEVKKLRPKVDFLIVAIHWGNEYVDYPNDAQKKMGHSLIDAGADLVIGHHPHILQGIEKYKNGVIFYSVGNFMFPQTDNVHLRATLIGMADLFITQTKNKKTVLPVYSFIPIWRNSVTYDPEFPGKATNDSILSHIQKISMPLNPKMFTLKKDELHGVTRYIIEWK
ncbi:MAG: hypothetical protein A2Y33_10265 [Spirochaetes bacterium GWF1_51_8]|nr:MAG: hypothetical protein A2Y33_10265 [Spirochaetes bacterium GWF1_51_8]